MHMLSHFGIFSDSSLVSKCAVCLCANKHAGGTVAILDFNNSEDALVDRVQVRSCL